MHQRLIVSAPSTIPLEARRAAWDRLWLRLLAEPPASEPEPANSTDDESDDTDKDAA